MSSTLFHHCSTYHEAYFLAKLSNLVHFLHYLVEFCYLIWSEKFKTTINCTTDSIVCDYFNNNLIKNRDYFSKIKQCGNDNVSIYKNIYQ